MRPPWIWLQMCVQLVATARRELLFIFIFIFSILGLDCIGELVPRIQWKRDVCAKDTKTKYVYACVCAHANATVAVAVRERDFFCGCCVAVGVRRTEWIFGDLRARCCSAGRVGSLCDARCLRLCMSTAGSRKFVLCFASSCLRLCELVTVDVIHTWFELVFLGRQVRGAVLNFFSFSFGFV